MREFITERSLSCPVIQMCLATAANTAKNRKHQIIEQIIGSFYVFLFCPKEIGKSMFGSSQHKAVIFCQDSLMCCACPHGAQLDRGKQGDSYRVTQRDKQSAQLTFSPEVCLQPVCSRPHTPLVPTVLFTHSLCEGHLREHVCHIVTVKC